MAMKERVERVDDVKVWYGELPVNSLYTAGIGGEQFFRTLKDQGVITGTKCEECGVIYVPGRIFCQRCLAKLERWVKVGPEGTLESWTVLHLGLDGKPMVEPQIVGLIKLDGASTMFVHRLGNVRLDQLRMGMKVRPVLKPKSQREGAITDIKFFEPA